MPPEISAGVALVTGASSGIGAAYANRLAVRGHDIILVSRDGARLEAQALELQARSGRRIEVMAADLSDAADLARVEARLRDDPSISMLVNNAGLARKGLFIDTKAEDLAAVLGVNVVALTRLTIAALSAFAPRGSGTIVNIGSVVSLAPEMTPPVYGATKAYVQYLTESLNLEIAGSGVRLQLVMPGLTRTEFFERAGSTMDHIDPEKLMKPEDLVDAALIGLDRGEQVTIPSMSDTASYDALIAQRTELPAQLLHKDPAPRYRR